MGVLDKLFGKKKEEPKVEPRMKTTGSYGYDKDTITKLSTTDGSIAYEYYDSVPQDGKFYDTTRIIVNPVPMVVNGSEIYEMSLS